MDSGIYHTKLPKNPREGANFLSYIFFCYTLPIFFKGRKKDLDNGDLYQALKAHKSDILGAKLVAAWDNEVKHKKNPSLIRATVKVFKWHMIGIGIVLAILEFCLRVTQPIFIGKLISFYTNDGKDIREAAIYAGAVVLCSAINVLFMHPYMLSTLHLGMKMRVAMCSLIYRKCLRLSKNALGDTTAGQVVNLLSNDVGRLELSFIFFHYLWVGPLETLIITYLMYREIGIAAVFGVAFLLMFIPFQGWLGKKTSSLRLKTALRTDERVRLMNEIIQGIQVIKMYTWEKPFQKLIEYARRKEVKMIRYVSWVRGIILSFIMFTTRVSIFISLVVFALMSNQVTAEKAFVITAYYNVLRSTMTVFFPQGIGQFAETLVSFRRIQKYLFYNETKIVDPDLMPDFMDNQYSNASTVTKIPIMDTITSGKHGNGDFGLNQNVEEQAHLELKNVEAKWDESNTELTLDDINLKIDTPKLVAIIGPVGSGKSSLIQTILKELPIQSGSLDVQGVISYASQEPWLFSATVRQNILFGLPMNKDRYRQVVRKCALERDFALFQHGDKTIVGERGQSLSGGQKARISLARAVYRQASIYLLDDPLSAVDTHVGKHLFEQCMRDYLRSKIVILVTHQLQYLQQADQIIIMNHGRIETMGTYESLQGSGFDFAKLLSETSKEEDDEDLQPNNRSRSGSRAGGSSNGSVNSVNDPEKNEMKIDEGKAEGSIGLRIYQKYFKAGGGYFMFIVMCLFCLASQILASGGDYFVNYWVNKNEQGTDRVLEKPLLGATVNNDTFNATTEVPINNNIWDMFRNSDSTDYTDIYIFTGITVATVVITLYRSFMFFNVAMKASINLHNAMIRGLTSASMYFFNTNPSGRILNRFSKDMGQVDEILPSVMMDVIQIFLSLFGIIVVIGIVNQYMLIPTVIIGIIFYFLRNFYLKTSRSVKRLEAINRSPVYSHLSSSLTGLSTIRAFGAQKILVKEFDQHQDLHSSAYYVFLSTSRAFGFWLDGFCVIFVAIVTLSFLLMGDAYGGNVGLAITQAIGMTGMVQWGMRQSAELENTMTAVERVVEYETIDPEPQHESDAEKKPPKEWPSEGQIKFDRLSLRYFPDQDCDIILKDLEFEIFPQEKIGIVGRTGAGKSSLINALFRLSYNEGSIYIDGRDINVLGLHDLRKKISIIPQEPVLFSGTMRYNLDPFDEYNDEKLWMALDEVKLKEAVSELAQGLQSKISEGGSNFSVGQRQLVCLARAILRENKILVMDEATANVDPQTDALIQTTIRRKFSNCTVLTIAHRLHTVMDSDRVLVMDAGRAIEFDTPYSLLTSEDGPRVFYSMVKQTGKSTFESLLKIAEQCYLERKNK